MLWILIKQQLLSLFASFRVGRQKGGVATRRSLPATLLILALLSYCAVYFAFAFFGIFTMLFTGFGEVGLGWLGFAVMGILVFLIDFAMTIFTTKSQLFEAKDNELLLPLPIRPRDILLSRMLVILMTDYLFESLVAIPAYVAWLVVGGFSFGGLVCFLATALFMPLLALSMSCLVGWLLSLVTARVKNATMVNTVLSLLLLAGYMALCLGLQSYAQLLLTNAARVADVVKRYLYPFYCLGDACANGNFLSALIYIAVMAVPFIITCYILARSLLSILTRKRGGVRRAYRERNTKARRLEVALLARESRRLFSSSAYLINASVGIVMLPILGVASFFLGDTFALFADLTGIPTGVIAPTIGIVSISMLGSMTFFTAPSISLEGQGIYDLKALPLPGHMLLLAKLALHLIAVVPLSLLTSLLMVIALPCEGVMGVLLFLVPPVFHTCFAAVGLWMNIAFPRFDWDSEALVVKQSMSVTLTMLISFFGMMLLIGIGALLMSLTPIPVWVIVVVLALVPCGIAATLISLLYTKGDRIFAGLG